MPMTSDADPPVTLWTRGDFVVATYDGRTVRAMVIIASHNAQSLAIMFDAMLGGYAGVMPIHWDAARNSYVDLLHGRPLVLTRVADLDDES